MKTEKPSEITKSPFDIMKGVLFLEEAARYFLNRPPKGEDRAYWANIYNAENCTNIAQYLKEQIVS